MDGGTRQRERREPPASALPDRIERVDPRRWGDVWIVGDVHGCLDALERLLDAIGPAEDDLLVFVGDLVRKGPDSDGVCQLVRQQSNLRSVRGNNEQKILDGRASCDLSDRSTAYLESLPVGIAIGSDLVVHGGIDHRKPAGEHTATDLLTLRSLADEGGYARPYWFERRRTGRRVFFGHTVLSEPFVSPWAVGLDTGCVYGGSLTAVHRATGEIVAVEPDGVHQERSADSIVDPRPPQETEP